MAKLRICLAASGGGHLRQLLDLEDVWAQHDHVFVTEDTALARSLDGDHAVRYVPHFALGQAKLGKPLRMLWAGMRNLRASASLILRERPDLVITTGAGSVLFTVALARLFGSKVVVVESFARFDRLSAFARLAGPFAHKRVVQSAALSSYWPRAAVFDPLRVLTTPRPPKKPLLFVTVGATLPFDRMISSIAELKERGEIPEEIVVQTGVGGLRPKGINAVDTLPFDQMLSLTKDADIVVCHGGTGSLITALRQGCRVIAMPRLHSLGEHYDDHQEEITTAFAHRGLVTVARSVDELSSALLQVRNKQPISATSAPTELISFLNSLIDTGWVRPRKRRLRPGLPFG